MKDAIINTNTMMTTRAKTTTNTIMEKNITASHPDRKRNCMGINQPEIMLLGIGRISHRLQVASYKAIFDASLKPGT
jgi:hypothetical protein